MSEFQFQLSTIGVVHVGTDGFVLELEPAYRLALDGLEGFSHLNVLWWAHFVDEQDLRTIVACDQPYQKAPPTLGIFATRSPVRPNPIAISVAPVLQIDQEMGRIHVAYLDAEDGTPVLDIKPYLPSTDRVQVVSTPDWCQHWPQWYEESGNFDWQAEFIHAR